jgi:hypothetical protein
MDKIEYVLRWMIPLGIITLLIAQTTWENDRDRLVLLRAIKFAKMDAWTCARDSQCTFKSDLSFARLDEVEVRLNDFFRMHPWIRSSLPSIPEFGEQVIRKD